MNIYTFMKNIFNGKIYFYLAAEVAPDQVGLILAPAGVEARLGHLLGRAEAVVLEGPLNPLEGLQPRAHVQHDAVVCLSFLHRNVNTMFLVCNEYKYNTVTVTVTCHVSRYHEITSGHTEIQ